MGLSTFTKSASVCLLLVTIGIILYWYVSPGIETVNYHIADVLSKSSESLFTGIVRQTLKIDNTMAAVKEKEIQDTKGNGKVVPISMLANTSVVIKNKCGDSIVEQNATGDFNKTSDMSITNKARNCGTVTRTIQKLSEAFRVTNYSEFIENKATRSIAIKRPTNLRTQSDVKTGNLTQMTFISDVSAHNTYYVLCPCNIGRLGNEMFQLAATIGISYSLNHIPVIHKSHPMLKLYKVENIKRLENVTLINNKAVGIEWLRNDADIYKPHNLTVSAYFQSLKHFQNVTGAVRKAFEVKQSYLQKAKSFLRQNIKDYKTIIGLHVRRGDFLDSGKVRRGRVVADGNYTQKAMTFYRQRYKDAHFVVCSDDMKWCKKNINGSDISYSKFKEPILDMTLMSLCHHMIITAGTFSWWGGWLSGGNVVYLKDFPRPGSAIFKKLEEDYYPPHWIGMSNGIP